MASVGKNRASSSSELVDRVAASRDLWPGGTLDFWQGRAGPLPSRVVWPETDEQVLVVLQQASRRKTPVIVYGAGSGVCGGARSLNDAIVLDLKRLNAIGPLDEERWTVEVQAGVIGQHLEDFLQARGFTLGHSPSSIWCSTVGGWAAVRSAGQFSSKYGVFEDMVLGLDFVAPGCGCVSLGEGGDEQLDWLPLILGSEGTLGVITRLRLRVWPTPQKRSLRGYRFPSIDKALSGMRKVMQEDLWPSVMRLYDPVDTRIGGRVGSHDDKKGNGLFLWRWLKALESQPVVKARSLALPLALPSLVNALANGVSGDCLMIVGWEGESEVVDALSLQGHRILREYGADLGPEPGEHWYANRHAVSYKLAPIFERGGFADTMEVAASWSKLEGLYHNIRKAVARRAVVMAHFSHMYPEGGSIYFSFAGKGDRGVYDAVWKDALQACLESGGAVSHHHGMGQLKADAATIELGPAVRGWRELKQTLDPGGILNPGRLYREGSEVSVPDRKEFEPEDGLVWVRADSSRAERRALIEPLGLELRSPFESLQGPSRWQRLPWWSDWFDVYGTVGEQQCHIGRAPRSAAGPDMRGWLTEHATEQPWVSVAVSSIDQVWMGEAEVEQPWRVAHQLLRHDLRPAHLYVEKGLLRVGFRGVAAKALGALASALVPGRLTPCSWQPGTVPQGVLEPCDFDESGVVCVNISGALRVAEVP